MMAVMIVAHAIETSAGSCFTAVVLIPLCAFCVVCN
jgi:hypothetical protein